MALAIKELQIPEEITGFVVKDDSLNVLANLSKINIFVGENNSGKSRLLRNLALQPHSTYVPLQAHAQVPNTVKVLRDNIKTTLIRSQLLEYNAIMKMVDKISNINNYQEKNGLLTLNTLLQIPKAINELKNDATYEYIDLSPTQKYISGNKIELHKELNRVISATAENIEVQKKNHKQYKTNFNLIYIPTLRGLKRYEMIKSVYPGKDIYKEKTMIDYFANPRNGLEIFSGLNFYDDLINKLLGNLSERSLISDYQTWLCEEYFNGKKLVFIPKRDDEVVYVKIGNENEQPIHHLGDGIQSIIILTYQLFANKNKETIFFIEEPELYMHPGLQRKLIETYLKSEFNNCTFFLTTHSNHFLDISMDYDDISIYTFKKLNNEEPIDKKEVLPTIEIENVSSGDRKSLELLGVTNSSVFLSNCTIWVEGITDRLYLRHYFDLYQKNINKKDGSKIYKEDLHFSFVEYSGNNITHWSFLDETDHPTINVDRLCGKLFLITDKDHEGKLERQNKLAKCLGERYYCLKCKEIENAISQSVLVEIINDYEGQNIINISDFKKRSYGLKYLGKYIDEMFTKLNKKSIHKYASKSGTITDKLNFSKKTIKYTNSYDDLSDEMKELCKLLYDFVKLNN